MSKKLNRQVLLLGEGTNQHTLYGNFKFNQDTKTVNVLEDSLLKHEQPNGSPSNEHKTLLIEKGEWVMGRQVELNPFDLKINEVFD